MTAHRQWLHWVDPATTLLILVMVVSGSACRTSPKKARLNEPEALRHSLTRRDAEISKLKEENGQQKIHLLEKEALIRQLEQRLTSQQQMLDDAILEVIRAKAKQRSLESRAETAAELAEAEIALNSYRNRMSEQPRPAVAKAEQLLKMAAIEFERQNFGGALYLVVQAKSLIKIGNQRLSHRGETEILEGEMLLAVPLPLFVTTRGNLREGPGRKFRILVTLDGGTPITAYSTKGAWLKVESDNGWSGWSP